MAALAGLHLAGAPPDTTAARQSAAELLPDVVGTPRGAQGITRTQSPHDVSLSGAEAAEESYAYTNAALENVQVDVLARHGSTVILAELDTEPHLASTGKAALEMLANEWRWR